jgi:hypothetical protein
MRKITIVLAMLFTLLIIQPVLARENQPKLEDTLKEYISEIAVKIQSTEDPVEKREILTTALEKIIRTFDALEDVPAISQKKRAALASLRQDFKDKYNELNGLNGFERVADEELDNFAVYIMQDLEQARNYITLSLGALLLIILVIIILA